MEKAKFELPVKYQPQDVEAGRYQWWIDKDLFRHQAKSTKPPYTILMPPPNITGKLHLGHAWDGYLEDALIRYKKLKGYDTLFIPGMDHAGIATQAKVEAYLREQKNVSRLEMGREEFIRQIWLWKDDYTKTIRNQWAKLGLAVDYNLEKFTLDQDVNHLVNYLFIHLYNKGIIYRGKRIVNWDPLQKTAISNIEVVYREVPGSMYYFRYPIANSKEYLVVATTRPETMFSDQALAVNPKDIRYQKYIGKKVLNPVNQQKLPIIADDYVDKNFETGVMKITPAHDFNDFEIGKRHGLKMPRCMNPDGSMNDSCGINYVNLDRTVARDLIVKTAIQNGSLFQVKPILHAVGFSERSSAIVEPLLSNQWFVRMDKFAKEILSWQRSQKRVEFIPDRFNEVLTQWMEKAQDWTISRQLWWGHRIPAWYHKKTKKIHVGIKPPGDPQNWEQDPDVLDTWFSSSLWPLATLQWKPQVAGDLFKRYYPINTLVTGYDIIFFWVARMMFQALELVKVTPFDKVLVHGLVRDNQGRKMSKSLNNGIDPMEIIEEYGSDALRFSLLTGSTPGQDLKFNQKKVEAAWNFLNKLWNISSYIARQLPADFDQPKSVGWSPRISEINVRIWTKLGQLVAEITKLIDNFELGTAGKLIYRFIWDDFASTYLEQTKIIFKNQATNMLVVKETRITLFLLLKNILILLHPFAPFLSEYIYQKMDFKTSIMEENWPQITFSNLMVDSWIEDLELIKQTVSNFRTSKKINKKERLRFTINLKNSQRQQLLIKNLKNLNFFLSGMLNSQLETGEVKEKTKLSLVVKDRDYFLETIYFDSDKNLTNLLQEQKRLESEIERSRIMLSNQEFLTKAKPEKVVLEQKKYQKYQKQKVAVLKKIRENSN